MKPAFALDFRDDAITLLHRSGGGWNMVGKIDVNAADLTEALTYFRSTALGLSPRGVSTKLVLPNDQILYVTVTAPGPDGPSRVIQIKAALEGLTPYAIKDLAFDWCGTGPQVQVAVIAKQTLAEAEAFARDHRFNPVSFVAAPDPEKFQGEPWFGATKLAPSILAEGEKVERDKNPVQISLRNFSNALPEPVATPNPTELVAAVIDAQRTLSLPDDQTAGAPEDVTAEVPDPDLSDPPQRHVESNGPEVILGETPVQLAPQNAGPALAITSITAQIPLDEPAVDPAQDATQGASQDATQGAAYTEIAADHDDTGPASDFAQVYDSVTLPTTPVQEDASTHPKPPAPADQTNAADDPNSADTIAEDQEAPMALDVEVDDDLGPILAPEKPRASVLDPYIKDENTIPDDANDAALTAFASRRGADLTAKPLPDMPKRSFSAVTNAGSENAPPLQGTQPLRTQASRTQAAPAKATLAKPSLNSKAGQAIKGISAFVTAPGIAGLKREKPVAAKVSPVVKPPLRTTQVAKDPRSPQTMASSSGQKSIGLGGSAYAQQRGKPRFLGLIMTAALLLLLAAVAAWSSYYFANTDTSLSQGQSPEGDNFDVPTAEDEMLADMVDPNDPMLLENAPVDANAGTAATDTPALSTDTLGAAPIVALAADPALAGPMVAGIPQDEILLAGMDIAPKTPDPLSLTMPEPKGDPPPTPQPGPPPFGTVYQFDAQGLIVPTPEGIITPEGVLVIAGKPPVVPKQRSQAVIDAAAIGTGPSTPGQSVPGLLAPGLAEPGLAEPGPETVEPNIFAQDPALQGKRPKLRPEGLAPLLAAPIDETSVTQALGGRLAGLRPKSRPDAVLTVGELARIGAQTASLASNLTSDQGGAISQSSVAISPKPQPRPKDMSRAIEAAIAAALQQPSNDASEEQTPVVMAEPARPEELVDQEPELASAAPRIPTKASVAKNATFKNAINLSKPNLIGIYGTNAERYALVRQANGRYKKLRIGDRFDGGNVAAITSNELRYQKGSRLVILEMPNNS